jgi:hypothetical protein
VRWSTKDIVFTVNDTGRPVLLDEKWGRLLREFNTKGTKDEFLRGEETLGEVCGKVAGVNSECIGGK